MTIPQRKTGRDQVLARLIRLCSEVFQTLGPGQAAAIIVNRIAELASLDRAVLVRLEGKPAVAAVTGGGAVAPDTAFADAVDMVRSRYGRRLEAVLIPAEAGTADTAGSPGKEADGGPLHHVQRQMGGTHILWVPLWRDKDNRLPPEYALWLERWGNRTWGRTEIELLQHAALFFGHALARRITRPKKKGMKRWIAGLACLLLAFMPVNASVTAPGRVVPDRPHYIFAPMDGIIRELYVQPGRRVAAGDILFRYDARVLDKRLEEAWRKVAVAKARLAKLQGAAHRDPESRAEMPVQELEVRQTEAEADFFRRQRERADVRSATAGVVVLDDPEALVGAAVHTGQTVMSVAEPGRTKIRLMVASGDIGLLRKGARTAVRLDSSPLNVKEAVLSRIGFDVRVSDTGVPSVMAEAIWLDDAVSARSGQKGTVKIYGDSTVLIWQVLRKPLVFLKTLIGI